MAPDTRPSATPEAPSEDGVDARLRAWFEILLAQPVPDALVRHLDQLEGGAVETDQACSV